MKLSIPFSKVKIIRLGLFILMALCSYYGQAQITWKGSTDTDWGTASNWDGGSVPGSSDNVIIPATSTSNFKAPTIDTDAVYEINNLIVESGGRLEIGGESASLIVNGNTENAGLIRANTNCSLVLLGTYTGTGSGTFANSRSVYGNSNYSIYAIPFTDGNAGLFNGVTAYRWNNETGNFDKLGNSSTVPGEGYYVSLFGGFGDTFTLGFAGSPVASDVSVPVTLGAVDHFNMLGNPYTAAIDVASFLSNTNNRTVTTGVVYFWDDGGQNKGNFRGGDFITANAIGAVGTNSLSDDVTGTKGTGIYDGYITSMQGFYIEATTDGVVSFTQDMQVAGNNDNANFYRTMGVIEQPKIKLALAGDKYESETLVAFDELATNEIDYALDAKRKLSNSEISLYSLNNDVEFAIQAFGLSSLENITVPLGYKVLESGDYLIKTKSIQGIGENLSVWLEDLENHTSYNLQENVDISVYLDNKNSDKRFVLKVLSGRVLAETEMASDLTLLKANERGLTIQYVKMGEYITVYDINGRLHFNKTIYDEEQPVTVDVKLNRDQIYILKVGSESLKFSIK